MPKRNLGGAGDPSFLQKKLEKIALPKDLSGKRVLDLGCGEGFFSLEAKRRGAELVIGVDPNIDFILTADRKAREEGLKIEVQMSDLLTLPEGLFDYVFLFSAIHRLEHPAYLLERVKQVLAPGGCLILECGVSSRSGISVERAIRASDELIFPTRDLLINVWLKDFSARSIGHSVREPGDAIDRYVFHCAAAEPILMFIEGRGGIGKTSLSRQFRGAPVIATDELFVPARGAEAFVHDVQKRYDHNIAHTGNILATYEKMGRDAEVRAYFSGIVAHAIQQCRGAPMIVIEGFWATHLRDDICALLGDGYRIWSTSTVARS